MNNPMAGSDVYKLIWGAILSPVLSTAECKLLLHKLCKIKRLEEWYVKKLNYKIKIINVYVKSIIFSALGITVLHPIPVRKNCFVHYVTYHLLTTHQ